jgi:hypothetical protein
VTVTIIAQTIPPGTAIKKFLKIYFTSTRIGNKKIVETMLKISGFLTLGFTAITCFLSLIFLNYKINKKITLLIIKHIEYL